MTYDLPNLRDTVRRQSRTGNLAILLLGAWLLVPYLMDRYRGEPTISSDLYAYMEDGIPFVQESITVKYPNRGSRNNILVDDEDRIVCARNAVSYWEQSQINQWYAEGFVGCDVPDRPYRICTVYSVASKSGIERKFGAGREFCTQMVYPQREAVNEDHG